MSNAILFSEMTPQANWEKKFNDWYDTEHIPLRMEVSGFQGARRYKEIDGKKYLAVYEMDHADVLRTDAYQRVKENKSDLTQWMLSSVSDFTRYICNQISEQRRDDLDEDPIHAPVLYPVFFNVPESREKEFNDWYEQDHLPTLLKNKDWLACRRYKVESGEPDRWTHLALHHLADRKALDSQERKEARASSWREQLAKEDWFKGRYLLFEKIKTFKPLAK